MVECKIETSGSLQSKAQTPNEYLDELPDDGKKAVSELRKVILKNLPKGFVEVMSYGMLGYVLPHSIYPKVYYCNPKVPLPFMNVASQKKIIAVYHIGSHANKLLMEWFTSECAKQTKMKLDMEKSCIRFKNMDKIPCKLIGELTGKISVKQYV